ncbi:hypothetical protein Goari_005296 [Gossypium aridum]|uniref:Uncharacterized protein n=1 Tax=Gossypium aridum TaxID=34290 RepID=A0A7J8Y713_GOSAI|nr:hypothetical protein [Gossypium aridum]
MRNLRPQNLKGPFTNNKEDMLENDYVPSMEVVCDKLEKLMRMFYDRCFTHSFESIYVWHIPALIEIFGEDSIYTTIRWRNFRTLLGKCTGCHS